MASQYDPPTTIRQADKNIASIEQSQSTLRSKGRHDEAAEWNEDLAEQRRYRAEIIRRTTAETNRIFDH